MSLIWEKPSVAFGRSLALSSCWTACFWDVTRYHASSNCAYYRL